MKTVKVLILRTAGTNCDKETAFAFTLAGAKAEFVHINELSSGKRNLSPYQIMAIPGGFSYGDDIASGKILANELKFKLGKDIKKFITDGKLIIGICNGFQILVKAGLVPNMSGDFKTIEATLTLNDSAKFEDRWVYLKKVKRRPSATLRARKVKGKTDCVWTRGIEGVIRLPIAHGEGKFIPKNKAFSRELRDRGLIVFEYVDAKGRRRGYPYNPNGSVEAIAGICDPSGRIFGLMPHPERHISAYQSPSWTRDGLRGKGDGLAIFINGVNFAKKNL